MASTNLSKLKPDESQQLLQLARSAIRQRLDRQDFMKIVPGQLPASLSAPAACFVTLRLNGRLRGCIGTLDASNSLAENVTTYACAAAFNDLRFTPVTFEEWENLTIGISVLSEPSPVRFSGTTELAAILRPKIDGVILKALGQEAVFLPQVWETLPDPAEFLYQLKRKAGLPVDIEPPALTAERFEAVCYYS